MHMEIVDHRSCGNLYENPGQKLFIVSHLSELFDVPAGCPITVMGATLFAFHFVVLL